jgi:isopentenyl-diphosphate delta-isomerase
VDIFTLEADSIENIEIDINPKEVMSVRWVDFKDLNNDIAESPGTFTPWLRIYLTKHASQILAK